MNSTEENRAWHRAPPLTVTEPGAPLAKDADRPERRCEQVYDAMAEASRTGVPYVTRLEPPPADPRVAHPPHIQTEE